MVPNSWAIFDTSLLGNLDSCFHWASLHIEGVFVVVVVLLLLGFFVYFLFCFVVLLFCCCFILLLYNFRHKMSNDFL